MRDIILKVLKEEVSKGKVTCDNCGWSWKLSEGGHDPYICHQCNHNNEPKKIQEQDEYRSYPHFSEKIYKGLKKLWDREGMSKELNQKISKILIPEIDLQKYIVEYFGGIEGVQKKLEDLLKDKIFVIKGLGNFIRFKITDIDITTNKFELARTIDLYLIIDEAGYYKTYNPEDGVFQIVKFSAIDDMDGTEFYDNLMYEMKSDIEQFLEDKIGEIMDLWVELQIEFWPLRRF